jgi:hypothetical protein
MPKYSWYSTVLPNFAPLRTFGVDRHRGQLGHRDDERRGEESAAHEIAADPDDVREMEELSKRQRATASASGESDHQ